MGIVPTIPIFPQRHSSQVKHVDLFSGIGGFALAAQTVWREDYQPILFCDNDEYCQSVLEKHWPDAPIYGDLRQLTAARHWRDFPSDAIGVSIGHPQNSKTYGQSIDLLSGGFPCQPFSTAGRRRGTEDNRYLWPEMLRIIREFCPRWVIAENVRGLLSQERGVVFEQVCSDLERLAYDVQAFVIPACAVNAPHRRDRVWIVAHSDSREPGARSRPNGEAHGISSLHRTEVRSGWLSRTIGDAPHTCEQQQGWTGISPTPNRQRPHQTSRPRNWQTPWPEVAARLCRMDDGLPRRMDRTPRLKALGNAIVPQVAQEIMRAIKHAETAVL